MSIIKELNLINPEDMMPAIGQYFFLVTLGHRSGEKHVAVLRCICDHRDFYKHCSILTLEGGLYQHNENTKFAGWTPMFENTKMYKITTL